MKSLTKVLFIVSVCTVVTLLCLPFELAEARGGGGGRGGGGSRGGGGGRASAGASRPASRPVPSRPAPSRPANRPSPNRSKSSFDYARSTPRPASRPVQPSRPAAYPQNIQRSAAAMNRMPNQRPPQIQRSGNPPARPGGSQRIDSVQRPTGRPKRPSAPDNRPSQGNGRPTKTDIDQFLQNRPETRPVSPGGIPSTRPAGGDLGTLPSGPGITGRPNGPAQGARPGRPGIADRPGQRPLRPEQLPANWQNRWNDWQDKGDRIRDDWYNDNYHHYHGDWYDNYWWDHHYHPYWPYYDDCDDCDWWSCPSSWNDMGTFMGTYLAPTPVYYTYGPGGSVFIAGDTVVLNDDQQVSTDTYAQELASQIDSIPEGASGEMEWLPLGVYTLVDEDVPESTMYLQLAVSKTGVIAGMFQNTTTENVIPVEGSVDNKTSRVVMRPTGKEFPMIETGLYNLIQDQTQGLVHFEDGKVQQYLLVRVDKPEKAEGSESAQPAELQINEPQPDQTQKEESQEQGR